MIFFFYLPFLSLCWLDFFNSFYSLMKRDNLVKGRGDKAKISPLFIFGFFHLLMLNGMCLIYDQIIKLNSASVLVIIYIHFQWKVRICNWTKCWKETSLIIKSSLPCRGIFRIWIFIHYFFLSFFFLNFEFLSRAGVEKKMVLVLLSVARIYLSQ